MNVFLNDIPFDARGWLTQGANLDDYAYDEAVVIARVQDETKR